MSLSKVHVNQGGVDWFFVINEVNLLFYIRKNLYVNIAEKLSSQAQNFREALILPEALFRWFKYLIIQWMHCGGLAENVNLLTLYI